MSMLELPVPCIFGENLRLYFLLCLCEMRQTAWAACSRPEAEEIDRASLKLVRVPLAVRCSLDIADPGPLPQILPIFPAQGAVLKQEGRREKGRICRKFYSPPFRWPKNFTVPYVPEKHLGLR